LCPARRKLKAKLEWLRVRVRRYVCGKCRDKGLQEVGARFVKK